MLSRSAVRSYSSGSIKLTSRESTGYLSNISVVINNGGSRAGKSGLSHLFSKFSFLNTQNKSALRFTRESELLGGIFSSKVTRDSIILNTQFLKADLPYYVEALGNTLVNPAFRPHELSEIVLPAAKAEYQQAITSNEFVGLESLHQISFRRGLGNGLYYNGTQPVTIDDIKQFSLEHVNNSNVAIFASGVNENDLTQFINDSPLSQLPYGASATNASELFLGQESRLAKSGESVALIGIPIKPSQFGQFETLSVALGNSIVPNESSPLSQINGANSHLYKYSDAGLFVVSVKGKAEDVATNIKKVKALIESTKTSDAAKSTELSIALQSSFINPLTFKPDTTQPKITKFNYVAIGDIDVLPYASDL